MAVARPPAMADVAARAGVSHQTVSRVLNAHPSVRPETRERVLAAIAELGYRRNSAARALVTARTTTVGLLTSGSAHFGPASTVLATEAALRQEGYFVSTSSPDSYDPAAAAAALERLVDQGVEGIVAVCPVQDVAEAIDDLDPPCPVVVVAARRDEQTGGKARYVHADQYRGAQEATEHLVDLGHTHVVHLAGPERWFDAIERAAAFRDVTATRDVEAQVVQARGWSARRGYELGLSLAEQAGRPGGPTGFFAANDLIAIGLLRAFWERGLRVPDDVSVVGFDDIEESAFLVPALTTVRQPFEALGRAAVRALLEAWGAAAGASLPRTASVIAPELVVRGSTAARG
ncbi:transcriptional regulator, LacI family [Xylanimonas cellulosilytica DSM 15894]|uniref:Transcriptional regulator, LacI family n=1 Tax=Xylanimonas cellulosilytica (strain DSM 15894 / JCM 12276 / CECT 5975 / KCTC 9989 / LMG 20990 / NBRC 107835 / XIL07) TaxID=446471 RepID=D1BVG8_XYLCX|nr:LacI family DNA-binding transcriptional regulator [Xylanimonas cellulosilytica]ACZ29439.1 transcriptional regulator, LacI family [Xylanimonas cellulosilytica DSM 15894]